MTMLFLQSPDVAIPIMAGFSETHPLIAIEPPGEKALLLIGGQGVVPAGFSANTGELMNDTGVAAEPYGAIMLVAFNVPGGRLADVDDWYDSEHIPLLMKADGWLRVRRFAVSTLAGKPWTSLAFHELRDPAVMNAPERHFARSTVWRARFEAEPWFQDAGRWLFLRD